MLGRTPSMDDIEARYRGLVLLATAVGDGEEAVTAPALLATMEEHCGVLPTETSMKIKCDRRWMKFERWVREVRGTSAALPYKCKLSFEDLPDQAWSSESVRGLLKDLGGDLIQIIPPKNRHELEVMAWLRDPSRVGKVVHVEIPEPKLVLCTDPPPQSLEEFVCLEIAASYGPSSPRKKKKIVYPVICHMKEVIDRGPLLAEDLPGDWLPNEGEDLTCKHKFTTVLGKVDGTMYEN
uniref:Uncharacterized protein n=1 Tax=Hordeum vulgare subsp. vulgare TaxID=112509 RepID=A0A8I6WEY8_HORVV